jgi:glycosyltransferase involved in cell wall biosynthesis
MNDAIELSIVICTRNRAGTLSGTLESLTKIKTARRWEVLVIDNASTDATADVIEQADNCGGRLCYLRADRVGLGAARDFAWRRASGRIISFTDDDCYPKADYVDQVIGAFEDNPTVSLISGRVLLHDPEDLRLTIDERLDPVEYEPYKYLAPGSVLGANFSILRSTLEAIGGFDPLFGAGTPFPAEDIEAAAAAIWSGARARFDPGPVVFHHHRRRASDLGAMLRAYRGGGGAYYVKYMLRRDSRLAYMRGRWDQVVVCRNVDDVVLLAHEMRSGFAYARLRRAYGFIAIAAPACLVALSLASLLVAARGARRMLRLRGRSSSRSLAA